jgi:AcrR family transcriptional regulator
VSLSTQLENSGESGGTHELTGRWSEAIEAVFALEEDSSLLVRLTSKGLATRRRIFESGQIHFENSGFSGARLFDIAETAAISVGTLYNYYESKEQLFVEVAFQAIRSLYPEIGSTTGLDPIKRIEISNRRYLETYQRQVGVLRAVEEVTALSPEFRAARHRIQSQFPKRTENSIRSLQRAGLVDPIIDPREAALALGAMVRHYAYFWLLEGETVDFERSLYALTRLWVQALGLDHGLPEEWSQWTESWASKFGAQDLTKREIL